jgi:uncharacterized Fe-S radical SAM superfamily protein PflX
LQAAVVFAVHPQSLLLRLRTRILERRIRLWAEVAQGQSSYRTATYGKLFACHRRIFLLLITGSCVFCINWDISHGGQGTPTSIEGLSGLMLSMQRRGCHNVNVVTPTHYLPHILLALDQAAEKGLRIPLVYNSCGFERAEILARLDGVVDIYLPDKKYSDAALASRYSAGAASYPEVGLIISLPPRSLAPLTVSVRRLRAPHCWKCTARWALPILAGMGSCDGGL